MYGAVYGKGPFVWLICRPFGAYLLFYHLPRMLRRKQLPFFTCKNAVTVEIPDKDTFAWQMPSLIMQPFGYALCLYFKDSAATMWD